MENLARHIIRASFSQERMNYIQEESRVLYRSKDGKNEVDSFLIKVFLSRDHGVKAGFAIDAQI